MKLFIDKYLYIYLAYNLISITLQFKDTSNSKSFEPSNYVEKEVDENEFFFPKLDNYIDKLKQETQIDLKWKTTSSLYDTKPRI